MFVSPKHRVHQIAFYSSSSGCPDLSVSGNPISPPGDAGEHRNCAPTVWIAGTLHACRESDSCICCRQSELLVGRQPSGGPLTGYSVISSSAGGKGGTTPKMEAIYSNYDHQIPLCPCPGLQATGAAWKIPQQWSREKGSTGEHSRDPSAVA